MSIRVSSRPKIIWTQKSITALSIEIEGIDNIITFLDAVDNAQNGFLHTKERKLLKRIAEQILEHVS